MLETEEVDVDYFTPSTSTSLSKIFGSSSKEEKVLEKSSLIYNAPLPPQVVTKSEEPKQTQYLFADTVSAYEWNNNLYEFRGKVGFAIFKVTSNDIHKILLYDSKKTPLSSLTVARNIEMKINNHATISYYDDVQKFWCVNPTVPKLEKILEILRSLKVNLQLVSDEREALKETIITENIEKDIEDENKLNENEKESDTDVSCSRKTKDSILKRMATMGQSVLPPPYAAVAQTSDSSDTNEPQNVQKLRFKPRVVNKKSLTERKTTVDTDKHLETNAIDCPSKPGQSHKSLVNLDNKYENVLISVPSSTNEIVKPFNIDTEANSLALLVCEQKVSNSELRININKMSDKLDILINKVNHLEIIDSNNSTLTSNMSQFQNGIIQKLLNEYEKKINKYEEFMKLKGYDCDTFEITLQSNSDCADQVLNHLKIENENLQEMCNEKDEDIFRLQNELKTLSILEAQLKDNGTTLLKEINYLKTKLNEAIANKPDDKQGLDITNKLKQIMNDTFQAISANFENEENYSGDKIKSIVGLVVKKTTIDSLKDL